MNAILGCSHYYSAVLGVESSEISISLVDCYFAILKVMRYSQTFSRRQLWLRGMRKGPIGFLPPVAATQRVGASKVVCARSESYYIILPIPNDLCFSKVLVQVRHLSICLAVTTSLDSHTLKKAS